MIEFVQIVTTTATEEEARKIAEALVEERLAACVQVSGPIRSVYRWQGKTEKADEWQCVAKTTSVLIATVEAAIKRLHSYECPETVVIPIVGGSASYLRWLAEQLADLEN